MRRLSTSASAVLVATTGAFAQAGVTAAGLIDFEDQPIGEAAMCVPGLTGGGGTVDWQILEDPSAPAGAKVVAETSGDPTSNRFPLCIFPELQATDVEVTVAFKPISGQVDQAAGIAVRVQDEDNYYIARANALEGNVRFYRVVSGRREQLAGVDVAVANGAWQTLGLRIQGPAVEVFLDGQSLFAHSDSTLAGPGGVALWTKADSLTHFDDVSITPLD